MIDQSAVGSIMGCTVRDSAREKIGTVAQVYLDDQSGQPEWVTVRTGLFGTRESFVPLAAARMEGDELVIEASKDKVSGAPQIDEDGHLSSDQEQELYRYYSAGPAGYADTAPAAEGAAGGEASGRISDEAMTRSEERLRAGTERVEAGRARLRKYVVTDTEQVSVPVSREEVRIEREPITDANREAAYDGPAISEEEHEVTLHEERPVVQTEAVPVERVRLGKETVTETETVAGEVRKEQSEVDDATGTVSDRDRS